RSSPVLFLPDADGNPLDGVVPVAEAIPLGLERLRATREVGRTRADRGGAWPIEARDQLPPLPALPAALADHARGLPRIAVDAHLDARDRRRAGPRNTANRQLAGGDLRVGSRLRDERAHPLQRDRLADHRAVALPLEEIRLALIVAGEGPVDNLDVGQPFDRGDPVPARDDETQRVAVLDRERLAVHRIGEERLELARVVEGEAALELDRVVSAGQRAAIGAAEHDLARAGADSGAIEDLDERNARPFGRAHRAELPLLAGYARLEPRSAVAGAFQGHDRRPRRHRGELAQAQLE